MFDQRNLKIRYKRYSARIRSFLLASKSREFLVFLCFFFISAAFWLLQALNEPYETEVSIPLRLENVPEEVVITGELPSDIRATVHDKGMILMTYILGKRMLPLTIDFEKYRSQGSHVKIPASTLEKLLSSRLLNSTRLISIKPAAVEYYYSVGERRMVPVKLNLTVHTQMEYITIDTLMQPDSVMVFAPTELLEEMKYVETEEALFEKVKDTINTTLPLKAIKGAKFAPSSVQIKISVDLLTERILEVPIHGVGFPKNKVLRTFPSKAKVRFLVAFHRFQQINPKDFRIEVPYTELINENTSKCRLNVTSVPAGISLLRVEPESVDFLIEQTTPQP